MRDLAAINRATWSRADVLDEFARLEGWISAGERAAFASVARRVRNEPALDIGVGAGRTASLVRLLTDDYRAIDYTPAMVEVCRRNHPGIDVAIGDGRDLSRFADESFGFVLFSFSGIDAVPHEDRLRILAEVRRVLRPDGWFVYSTHNLDGPSARVVPWRSPPFPRPLWYRTARWWARLPLDARRYRRRWANWVSNRRLHTGVKGEWAIRASAPHDFGIVIHYVSLPAMWRELAEAGFADIETYDSERGMRLGPQDGGTDVSDVNAFYVVARRA